MYLEFYGLSHSPFSLVTDPQFMFYSESHCEAMAHLLYGVRERKGIMMMLGEAGTGKTTLIKATLEILHSTRVTASVIMNPMTREPDELLAQVLRRFGLEGFRPTGFEMLDVLQRFLVQQVKRSRIPVLIVDEAQEMAKPLLEQLRLLSNLEHDGEKLLQIVLAGQPELSEHLEQYEMRALRQRIVVRCRLASLNAEETWMYLQSRLLRAGVKEDRVIFSPEAVEAIYGYSGGIPRLINMVADNAMLAGYSRQTQSITGKLVNEVAGHLELHQGQAAEGRSHLNSDVIRASASWREVLKDIRRSGVPEPLQKYVEKLRAPAEQMTALAQAVQKGN